MAALSRRPPATSSVGAGMSRPQIRRFKRAVDSQDYFDDDMRDTATERRGYRTVIERPRRRGLDPLNSFVGKLIESDHGQFEVLFLRVLDFVVADAVEAPFTPFRWRILSSI
jgi:hypothetical protein